jgi:hypothetical protein
VENVIRFIQTTKQLTKMIGKPILWNNENQMTGDVMHLIGNKETEKLDSLKVLNNAFIFKKTVSVGYNQDERFKFLWKIPR